MAQSSPDRVRGGCLCGAVAFEIELPTRWCAHCHCSMCRRAHGAPMVTWIGVLREQFHLLGGELGRFKSSAEATRAFCRACGSPMLFESTRWPDEVHIARACIPGDLDRDPTAHVFFSDRATWLHLDAALPLFGGPSGTEKLA